MASLYETNLKEFNTAVERWAREVPPKIVHEMQRRVAFTVLETAANWTPFKTGRAKNNWQVGIGETNESVLPDTGGADPDPVSREAPKLNSLPMFSVVYVFNNVEYIIHLEEGTPHMAPFAMLAKAIVRARGMFP